MAAEKNSQMPLRGAILCCTAISPEERTRISDIAAQLGAEHKYDLTSDVTHLLIGNIDTPKYRYVAKERPDVKVLTPEWVDAVRDQWMAAEDVDVAALEEEYRAPPFFGLRICLTGFDDLDQREQISDTVRKHGAEYNGDLTREITHLIAAEPKGKKYEYARQWNVQVVTIEWINDSIERGLALDEKLYDPILPPEERGKGAWRKVPLEPVIGKRPRSEDEQSAAQGPNRRKIRRTVSAKFGSQTGAMWADITSGTSQQKEDDEWDLHREESDAHATSKPKRTANETPESDPIPPAKVDQSTRLRRPQQVGIFQGRLVAMYGFNTKKTSILREALTNNGAFVADLKTVKTHSAEDQASGFLVVPYDDAPDSFANKLDTSLQRVTEFWVEACLHRKTLVDRNKAILCRPFPVTRIDGFEDIVVCSTGFAPIDLVHLSKVVKLMGAKYDEYLKDATSVLICSSESPNQEKLVFAVERAIPVVNAEWLWNSITNGQVEPIVDYLLAAISDRTEGYKQTPKLKRSSPSQPSQSETQDTVEVRKVEEPQRPARVPKPRTTGFRKPPPLAGAEAAQSDFVMPADHEDNPPEPNTSGGPLQELPPQFNSPSRRSQSRSQPLREPPPMDVAFSFGADENTSPADATGPESTATSKPAPQSQPEPDTSANLHNAISVLLAQKQASRPPSAKNETTSADAQPRRRKKGLLGRASSATSNPSSFGAAGAPASNPLSRTSSIASEPGPATQALQQQVPVPSQALIFEDPSVQRQREDMIRRMGGKVVKSRVVSVEGVGVVRDAMIEEAGGVASRVRRRARGNAAGTEEF